MMNRRSFLSSILVAACSPAIVSAGNIMRVRADRIILYGDGLHDDLYALQAIVDGKNVRWLDGSSVWTPGTNILNLRDGTFNLDQSWRIPKTFGGEIWNASFNGTKILGDNPLIVMERNNSLNALSFQMADSIPERDGVMT